MSAEGDYFALHNSTNMSQLSTINSWGLNSLQEITCVCTRKSLNPNHDGSAEWSQYHWRKFTSNDNPKKNRSSEMILATYNILVEVIANGDETLVPDEVKAAIARARKSSKVMCSCPPFFFLRLCIYVRSWLSQTKKYKTKITKVLWCVFFRLMIDL